MAHTLFISDLHLPVAGSPLRDAFARFLAGPARGASALYILGDLFESWAGDDAGLAEYGAERACLRALTGAGVPVYFQHGNRDFLVGRDFAAATGVQLLPDPLKLDLHGTPTLVSHGDQWCTDDVRYQRWRRLVRNRAVQAVFGALPRAWRERFVGAVRADSAARKQMSAAGIMDVNDGAIRAAFREHGVARMIHGHTHRPATHDHDVDGRSCRRHVLADWHPGRCAGLRVDASGVHALPIDG
jgi:UDP-2,3-diacylglucosamine hydrolase